MTFKPYPWLTFFTVLIFAALITMGTWQVQRYDWKKQLNAKIKQYANSEPELLSNLLVNDFTKNLGSLKYRPVKLIGEYLPEQQVLLRDQYKKSDRVIHYGFYVFTPFRYITAKGKKIVMVERGFITENVEQAPELYKKLPIGETTIVGNIKLSEIQGSFLPNNILTDEVWYWRDVTSMGKKFNFTEFEPIYISLREPGMQDFPKIAKLEIKSASNHLSYLITWFALAVGLVILYIYMHIYNERLYLTKKKPEKKRV